MNTKSNNTAKEKLAEEKAKQELAKMEATLKAEAEEFINSRPKIDTYTPAKLPRDEYQLRTPNMNPYGKVFNRYLGHTLFPHKGN